MPGKAFGQVLFWYDGPMEEIEIKFLDVDVPALEAKLAELGAIKEFDRMYKRRVYDYPDQRLNSENSWVRVRDEGDKVTMGYKQRQGVSELGKDTGMHEVEFTVSSFDGAAEFLERIGMTLKFYEENRRIRYVLNGVEVDIDFWPLLNPYVEIEGKTWDEVNETATALGFNLEDKKICVAMQIYQMAGIDEMSYIKLTFDEQIKRQ